MVSWTESGTGDNGHGGDGRAGRGGRRRLRELRDWEDRPGPMSHRNAGPINGADGPGPPTNRRRGSGVVPLPEGRRGGAGGDEVVDGEVVKWYLEVSRFTEYPTDKRCTVDGGCRPGPEGPIASGIELPNCQSTVLPAMVVTGVPEVSN